MRRTILVGLGLALSVAGTAVAQQPQDSARHKGHRGDRAARVDGRRAPDGLLLKGITLSEQQRTQIAQLRKSAREQMQANREQNRSRMEELRAARQRGDTAAVRKAFEARRAAMQQQRDQHLAAVRNLLTPEQRVQFDKNVTELKTRMAQRAERGRAGKGHGPRGRRGGASAPNHGPGLR